jgi:phage terminase small subunit
MLQFLIQVALGQVECNSVQVRAAIAAVNVTHGKAGDTGKKKGRDSAAKEAGGGRYASAEPPRLVVDNT